MKVIKSIGLYILGLVIFFGIQSFLFRQMNREAEMSSTSSSVLLIIALFLPFIILIGKDKMKSIGLFVVISLIFSFLYPKMFGKAEKVKINDCDNIEGTYKYEDESADLYIVITGQNWISKFEPKTNVSSEWDAWNTTYEIGTIKKNELYGPKGIISYGNIDCGFLNTTFFNRQISFEKQQ